MSPGHRLLLGVAAGVSEERELLVAAADLLTPMPAPIQITSMRNDPIWLVIRRSTTTGAVTAMSIPRATGRVNLGLDTTR